MKYQNKFVLEGQSLLLGTAKSNEIINLLSRILIDKGLIVVYFELVKLFYKKIAQFTYSIYFYIMSVITRKTHIKLAKQQYILDATVNLIVQIGIDNIRMEDISIASNYTKRTLYAYFTSKNEIILRLLTDDLIQRWNYQKEQISMAINGLEKLKIWALSLFDYYDNNRHSLQIQNYISYHSVQPDKVNQSIFERFKLINDELAKGLRDIFNLGVEDGSFRYDIEIDITISQFLYAYRAILGRAFSDSYSFADFDKSKYTNHFLNLFLRSLKNK